MKAIRYESYGGPERLRLAEVERPVPEDGEVLIRVRAAGVNPLDWHFMRGMPYLMRAVSGLTRPKVHGLGVDLAGRVEEVGANVTAFQPGDEVFGMTMRGGMFAEYVVLPQTAVLVPKPAGLTPEEAAGVPTAALTAWQGLHDRAGLKAGQKVLINGASGGVGTFAVQVAKAAGAEVDAVCGTGNVDLVASLGADRVIDYTKEDFTRETGRYDVFLDNVGNHPLPVCRRVLTPSGIFLPNSGGGGGPWLGPLGRTVAATVTGPFARGRTATFLASPDLEDLRELARLLDDGTIRSVVGRTYPLAEVPDAIRHVEQGHARGKVVITV